MDEGTSGEPRAKVARFSVANDKDVKEALWRSTRKSYKMAFLAQLLGNFCKKQNSTPDLSAGSAGDLDNALVCFYHGL